jgi:stage IV sporulation protein FB
MKIEIHNITYITMLISFLSGYFQYIYILLLIIFIHEFGHFFISNLINIKANKIIIYPFGGLTIYDSDLNLNTNKELISLLGGITFQLLFYFLVVIIHNNNLMTHNVFNIIKRINIILISFNFLPILPLDGGRLLNILLDKIFPYKLSNKLTLIVSILFLGLFIMYKRTILSILLFVFLLKEIILEINNIDNKYMTFLFERYKNNYSFKKIKRINNLNKFKRDYYHIINGITERKYLSKLFDRND